MARRQSAEKITDQGIIEDIAKIAVAASPPLQSIERLSEQAKIALVEPLIVKLKDGYKDVRREAAAALGKIADPRAVDPLIAALKDEDNDLTKYSIEKTLKAFS